MASLQDVYGGPAISQDPSAHGGVALNNSFSLRPVDATPRAVALTLIFAGGVLWLLRYYGFRFNFGVAGGK